MPKTIAILQPGYLPWLGAFDQMARSDVFVFYDDVQYTRNDWRNRNRIKGPGGAVWLTVPVQQKGRFGQLVLEAAISGPGWRRKHWRTIEQAYARAPAWPEHREALAAIYERDWGLIADLDIELTTWLARALGIRTELVRSSALGVTGSDPNQRLVDIVSTLGGDAFIEGAAGRDYLDPDLFTAAGIRVVFQEYSHPEYTQLWPAHGFLSHLSALDLLLNCGPESLAILTGDGTASA